MAALAFTFLVLAAPLPTVAASSGTITAVIASPADGAVFTRLDTISFTDASFGEGCTVSTRQWSFGDGTGSTATNPTH
ncbi:MAG TPA: hypothetical protein VNX21_08795, partial [Candidatus Thermoplasmatota archaeon]|nr:hypothetical protein [Candidatus Thermoplasmatota archaeon]